MNNSLFDFAGGIQLIGGTESAIALPVILAVICLLGFAGNIAVIVALAHDLKNGKASVINALVLNLSNADLLIMALCVPVRAVTYSRHQWTFGNFVCKTADWFQHTCLAVKSLTLAAISLARYKNGLNPPECLNLNRKIVGAIIMIWIGSVILTIPQLIFASTVKYQDVELCVFDVPFYAANFMGVFSKIYPLAAYVIPIICTVACYLKVIRGAKLRKNNAQNVGQLNTRFTLTLICVSTFHALVWLPELSVWVWARHRNDDASRPHAIFLVFAQAIVYIGCAANPIIFLTMSEEFRGGMAKIWTCVSRRASRAPEGSKSQKPGENGEEIINSLQDVKSVSPSGGEEALGDFLPDVRHFWQERRNTTAGDENDPVPWEREDRQ